MLLKEDNYFQVEEYRNIKPEVAGGWRYILEIDSKESVYDNEILTGPQI